MTFRTFRLAALAGLATAAMIVPASSLSTVAPSGPNVAKLSGIQLAQACFTDEGYGRKMPCSTFYKGKKKKKAAANK